MSAQILNAELTTLFQESKRKNTELRNVYYSCFKYAAADFGRADLCYRPQRNPFKISRLYQLHLKPSWLRVGQFVVSSSVP